MSPTTAPDPRMTREVIAGPRERRPYFRVPRWTIANPNTALRKKLAAVIDGDREHDRYQDWALQHAKRLAVQGVRLQVVHR